MTYSENNLPSTGKMIRRSLLRQCPRCANRSAWFTSWFKQGERCIGCGIKRTRDTDGHELGSMTIASVLNIMLIMAAIGIAVAFTAPDVPVLTLYIVLASAALVFPGTSFSRESASVSAEARPLLLALFASSAEARRGSTWANEPKNRRGAFARSVAAV